MECLKDFKSKSKKKKKNNSKISKRLNKPNFLLYFIGPYPFSPFLRDIYHKVSKRQPFLQLVKWLRLTRNKIAKCYIHIKVRTYPVCFGKTSKYCSICCNGWGFETFCRFLYNSSKTPSTRRSSLISRCNNKFPCCRSLRMSGIQKFPKGWQVRCFFPFKH